MLATSTGHTTTLKSAMAAVVRSAVSPPRERRCARYSKSLRPQDTIPALRIEVARSPAPKGMMMLLLLLLLEEEDEAEAEAGAEERLETSI